MVYFAAYTHGSSIFLNFFVIFNHANVRVNVFAYLCIFFFFSFPFPEECMPRHCPVCQNVCRVCLLRKPLFVYGCGTAKHFIPCTLKVTSSHLQQLAAARLSLLSSPNMISLLPLWKEELNQCPFI